VGSESSDDYLESSDPEEHGPHIPCGAANRAGAKNCPPTISSPRCNALHGSVTVDEFLEPLRDLSIREIVE